MQTTITLDRLAELLIAEARLKALDHVGVDDCAECGGYLSDDDYHERIAMIGDARDTGILTPGGLDNLTPEDRVSLVAMQRARRRSSRLDPATRPG